MYYRLIVLLLLVILLGSSHVINAAPSCTVTVPTSVTLIDGAGNYSQIKPGNTICLAGGNRAPTIIKNIRGQASKPITIINSSGVVRIDSGQKMIGLDIQTSSNLRLTGTGLSDQCGSMFSPGQQQCGIDIFNATKELSIQSAAGDVNDIEIDHITVHNSNPSGAFPTGISIHPLNQKHISGIHIHHTYVHDTMFEGMYIGSDPNKAPADNGTMSDVTIDRNLVERTGFDGINVKQTTNMLVHHNIVNISGLMNGKIAHVPEGGIQMASCMGEVFNNLVIDSDDTGLNIGRELSNSNTKFYNNVIISSTNEGIKTGESNASIYNNTIINSGAAGINAPGTNAKVYDNIVVGTIVGKNTGNNLIGSLDAMKFVNAATGDYHLTSSSPALNLGGTAGPTFDFDDKPRPQGGKSDIGAYEFGSAPISPTVTGVSPIPTATSIPGVTCPKKTQGDSNCDNTIDIIDFEIFRKEYTGVLSSTDSDFDGNGVVEIVDFEIWRRGIYG